DPLYKQLQMDASAGSVSDAASRAAATQKALIAYGQVPDLNQAGGALGLNQGWFQSDVTPQAIAAANNNKLSYKQRMEDAYQQSLLALRQSLRARGAVRTGEAGYGQQQALNQYDQAKYDATNQLLDLLSGYQSSFAGAERARQQQLAQAQPDTVLPAQTVAPFYVGPVGSTAVKWAPRQKPGVNPVNPLGL